MGSRKGRSRGNVPGKGAETPEALMAKGNDLIEWGEVILGITFLALFVLWGVAFAYPIAELMAGDPGWVWDFLIFTVPTLAVIGTGIGLYIAGKRTYNRGVNLMRTAQLAGAKAPTRTPAVRKPVPTQAPATSYDMSDLPVGIATAAPAEPEPGVERRPARDYDMYG
ncbi:MAG: hypothetical protein RAK18_07575 [Conexivisphaerales archaeon]|jgi:hypothetical protein|nr:hypothetical protein [Conexivisphaerales archaeon]